jgi:MFS family permease
VHTSLEVLATNMNQLTAVDSSLSAASHVAIASAFNKTNLSAWPVNAFLLTSMSTQPLYARVSDHVGRKAPYLFASTVFAIGMMLSATAPSWSTLIAARATCGIGVGGLMTMGSVILTDMVGVQKRGYYQSMNYVVYGAGSALVSRSSIRASKELNDL